MKSRNFLSGVGIVALAGALAAVPAHASEGDAEGAVAEETSSEETPLVASAVRPVARTAEGLAGTIAPIDTFAGLKTTDLERDFIGTINLAIPRSSGEFVGSVTRPTEQIIVRDDVGINFGDPDNLVPSAVHLFFQDNNTGGVFFNCTGTLINPRTVLSAAHCFNSRSSEAYGVIGAAPSAILVATGQNSANRLFTYINTGASYSEGGIATSTDVIIHPSGNLDNGALPFPWADVALVALDEPILDTPVLPILLTPLTELTHVLQVGYGTNGTGTTGATNAGNRFLRRVGENMLGAIASSQDLIDAIFPGFAPSSQTLGFETQALYFVDFDNPNRVGPGEERCTFSGTGISCQNLQAVLDLDWFDGDALPGEVATAPGDSGSAIIVDELYDFPVVAGVLSGGFDFFGINNRYSDISFYNPLYPFFEFITENTPYKYVSANAGDGNWSDPTHWTQDLDPGFFIDDGTGTLVNGIPTGNEPGVFEAGPKLGLILGQDISGNDTTPAPVLSGFDATVPESSVLLGPGSTGFVPMNTDGTPGTAFANPAQYFEVHLNRAGTTTVDMDVEIDKLVINNDDAGFVLADPWNFTTIIDVEHLAGTAEINGTLNTPFYILGEGSLEGDGGTINTNALFNVAGLMSAGGTGGFGTLTINGDYVQTSGGALWADYTVGRRRAITSDFYSVSGVAVLDGDLVVATGDRAVRFGTTFTVLSAGAIDGDFASTFFVSRSPIMTAVHSIEGGDVVVRITARSIRGLVGAASPLGSIGGALDTIRANNFDQFVGLFDIIDGATVDTLGATLSSLAPTSAFSQTFTANTFSQRFTGQIAQRTLALRGGSRAAGGFSAAGNASFALAGNTPTEAGRIGIFGSASGVFLNGGQQGGVLGNGVQGFGFDAFSSGNLASGIVGANAFEQASLTQAGEMTVGADMRVSDGFSFGVAVSEIRNSQVATSALQPQEDRSQSVAIYATYTDGGLFADGYAGTSDQRFGVERAAQGDFTRAYANAIGQADGRQTFGGLRLGYAFDLAKGVEAGPVMSMDYVRNRIGGYDEIGAGAFGLSIADRTFTSMGAKAGAMASFDIRSGQNSAIRAFGSVAYARELADTQDVVTAHFFGAADTPFSISNQLDPEWVSVNAGAEMQVGANLRASISVTSDMGRGVLSNDQAQASLSWRF